VACWRKLTLTGRWRLVDGDAPGSFVRAREAQLMAVRIADMEIPLAPRRVGRRGCRASPRSTARRWKASTSDT